MAKLLKCVRQYLPPHCSVRLQQYRTLTSLYLQRHDRFGAFSASTKSPHSATGNCSKLVCHTAVTPRQYCTSHGTFVVKPHGIQQIHSRHKSHWISEASEGAVTEKWWHHFVSPDFPPIQCGIATFNGIHSVTGVPWWLSIIITAVTVRLLITLPIAVFTMRESMKCKLLDNKLDHEAHALRQETELVAKHYGWSKREADKNFYIRRHKLKRDLYARHKVHPAKYIVLKFLQLPVWVSFTIAINNMAIHRGGSKHFDAFEPTLEHGGALWFPNLLVPDSTFVLPLLVGLLFLANIEFSARTLPKPTPTALRVVFIVARFATVWLAWICTGVPSSVSLYWASSAGYGLVQAVFLQTRAGLRLAGAADLADTRTAHAAVLKLFRRDRGGRDARLSMTSQRRRK